MRGDPHPDRTRLHAGRLLAVPLLALSLGGCRYIAAGAAVGAAVGAATMPPEPLAGSSPSDAGTRVQVISLPPTHGTRGAVGAVLGAVLTFLGLFGYCAATECLS